MPIVPQTAVTNNKMQSQVITVLMHGSSSCRAESYEQCEDVAEARTHGHQVSEWQLCLRAPQHCGSMPTGLPCLLVSGGGHHDGTGNVASDGCSHSRTVSVDKAQAVDCSSTNTTLSLSFSAPITYPLWGEGNLSVSLSLAPDTAGPPLCGSTRPEV